MKKIMFHLNSLEQGGVERVVSTLANELSKDSDYVVLISTEWFGENEYKLDEKVRRIHVGLTPDEEKEERYKKVLLRIHHLRKVVKKEKPDIIIAFARKANYRALQATIGMKIPVIGAVRTDPRGCYDHLVDKIFIPFLFRKASGFVFQTKEQRDFFPKYVREKSKIILNPLNPKYITSKRVNVCRREIVHSGRLDHYKNQALLVEAFVHIHESHPDYILKIYGSDSHDGTKEIIEKIIAENKAESYIHLMGACNELEKVLPGAAAYAFTSNHEGLPNALMEAMAIGLPCISTDCPCGGPNTLIQNEWNGLLIPTGDEQALVEGLNRLIENTEFADQLGTHAMEICQEANVTAIVNKWREYIESVCRKEP